MNIQISLSNTKITSQIFKKIKNEELFSYRFILLRKTLNQRNHDILDSGCKDGLKSTAFYLFTLDPYFSDSNVVNGWSQI